MSVSEDRNLMYLLLDLIEYDFAEYHEDVQGNWKITRSDNYVIIDYQPMDDSPFPAAKACYRIERLS